MSTATGLCQTTEGISVVVDFGPYGGIDEFCDTSGTTNAKALFAAHESLTYSSSYPGALVCRIDGQPAAASCVGAPPAASYWALFVANGHTSAWSYASSGVASLTVHQGGSVAFAWQGSATQAPPGVAAPVPVAPAPPPIAATSAAATQTHDAPLMARTSSSEVMSSAPTPSAPAVSASVTSSAAPTTTATTVSATQQTPVSSSGELASWIAPALVVAVIVAAVVVSVLRRRR